MSTMVQEETPILPGDDVEDPPVPQPPDPEDALFDKCAYDDPELAVPTHGGRDTNEIALKFSGTIILNRLDPADCELIRMIDAGENPPLQIEYRHGKASFAFGHSDDGLVTGVRLEQALTVVTAYRPA